MTRIRDQLIQFQQKNYRKNQKLIRESLDPDPALERYEKEYQRCIHLIVVTGKGIIFFKKESQEESNEVILITETAQHTFSERGKKLHQYQVISAEEEEGEESDDKEYRFLSTGAEEREENENEKEKRYGNAQKRGSKENGNTR